MLSTPGTSTSLPNCVTPKTTSSESESLLTTNAQAAFNNVALVTPVFFAASRHLYSTVLSAMHAFPMGTAGKETASIPLSSLVQYDVSAFLSVPDTKRMKSTYGLVSGTASAFLYAWSTAEVKSPSEKPSYKE